MAEHGEVPFRGGGFAPERRRGVAPAAFVVLLVAWEAAARLGWISPIFLPRPSAIAAALVELIRSGALWGHLGDSIARIAGGWVLGTAAGFLAGLAIGLLAIPRSVGIPFVSALFPIPKIALLPLMILWFGIGESSKIATIALGVFFPTVIAVYAGVDGVPRNLIRMAQSFGVPPRDIVLKIVLPGAWPAILSGFRITASIGLILVVSAEMIGAQRGIGQFVLQAGNLMIPEDLLAGIVVLSLLGLTIGTVLTRLERRLGRWR
ncbi:MAG: ABC transporter permease [Alphaproteobacteria bacterium]|nr:ABC transporter permease [Alphaproteobacteria bacterium]